MDPLFPLDADNVDLLLPYIKEKLMLQEENSQMHVVERLSNLLEESSEFERSTILRKLINFDIISSLCHNLQTSNERMLMAVLNCLTIVSELRYFHENRSAADVTDSILKVSYLLIKSGTEKLPLLQQLVDCISIILLRAANFGIELNTVCVPRQVLIFLKVLSPRNSSTYRLRFTASTLLNVVLKHAIFEDGVFDDEDHGIILDVCDESLNAMKDIIDYSDDDRCILLAITTLCETCACGIRFYNIEYKKECEQTPTTEQLQKGTTFGKLIYNIMMNTIIPYVKNADLSQIDIARFNRDFIISLHNLYYMNDCNPYDLSNHLTANGYLKYFLLLLPQSPQNLRRSACTLLTQVLSTLGKQSLSVDKWPDGVVGFSKLLFHGLIALPKDPTLWIDTLGAEGDDAITLVALLYYHYLGTQECDMVSLKALIRKVMELPENRPDAVPVLKPLWFLFAISALNHPSPSVEYNYDIAVKRLTKVLLCSELSDCYTHHIDLVHYCLKSLEVPNVLKSKVMDLWLIESDGDIKSLLTFNCNHVLRHCLLVIVQTGCTERVVNLAAKGIRELMRVNNAEGIAEIIWEILPKFLSYKLHNVGHVKAVLELALISQPRNISTDVIKSCTSGITKIILAKKMDVGLKTLAAMLAYTLLSVSTARKYFKVLEIYITQRGILEDFYHYGFIENDNSELCAVCLNLLTFIIRTPQSFDFQRKRQISITIDNIAQLLWNSRTSPYKLACGLQFMQELLNCELDESPVVSEEIGNDEGKIETIINMWEILHVIHAKSDPAQKDMVYRCLSAMLKFCLRNAESLMYHLCTLMSNYDLVTSAIGARCMSPHFLEFVTTWLRYRKRYCDDEGRWNEGSLFKAPFDETLARLAIYLDTLKDKGEESAYLKLRYAVSALCYRILVDRPATRWMPEDCRILSNRSLSS